jgi:ABC-type branched-subunit amino acid transport system substrate-binding protein
MGLFFVGNPKIKIDFLLKGYVMRKLGFLLVVGAFLVSLSLPVLAQDSQPLPDFIQHTECTEETRAAMAGQTVQIIHFGDLSGPFAFITQPLLKGVEDALKFFNEHGGVCGAMMEQVYDDTKGDPASTQSIYDRFSTQDPKPNLLLLYASSDAEALRARVEEDQIPVIISAGSVPGLYGEDGMTPGWIFATNPLYGDQLGSMCDYFAANPDQFPNPSIGYISWEGAFGRAADTPEVWSYCESKGVAHAGSEFFLPTATDISTSVQNLVDNGATILYTNSLATGPALVAKTIVDLGLQNDVRLAGVNWALDTSVGLLGQATFNPDTGLPSTNGLIGSMPFYWWTERSQPGIALINEQADAAQRPPTDRNIAYLLGWTSADLYIEIYIQTANRVGFANITGADIKETLEQLNYRPLGLQDVAFTPDMRASTMNRIAQMAYLGQDGMTPASAENPPLVVTVGERQLLVPIIVPLTDFAAAPDLRPGMMEMMPAATPSS